MAKTATQVVFCRFRAELCCVLGEVERCHDGIFQRTARWDQLLRRWHVSVRTIPTRPGIGRGCPANMSALRVVHDQLHGYATSSTFLQHFGLLDGNRRVPARDKATADRLAHEKMARWFSNLRFEVSYVSKMP